MANFPGVKHPGVTADTVSRLYVSGWQDTTPPQWLPPVKPQVGTQLSILNATLPAGAQSAGTVTQQVTNHAGVLEPAAGLDWWGEIIILARSYPLGIILSEVQRSIEIYSTYRRALQTWSSWTNNVDSGVSIPDFPTPPQPLNPQSGYAGTLTVSTQGPPTLNGTIDFVVLGLGTFTVPVTGQRAVMIPFLPEAPFVERLVFATDVLVALTGTEQRVALRDVPRQLFDAQYVLEGHDRRAFLPILFDAQGRAAGLPMWHEPTWLTAPVSVSDTTITVESTAYADWRANSVGIVWEDSETYEALEVSSYTGTTVTFKSPFQNAFSAGAMVMPVRTAYFEEQLRGLRYPQRVQQLNVRYSVVEAAVDLSSSAAFSTYRSKILLDGPNWITAGTLEESLSRKQIKLDGTVGLFNVWSDETASRRGSRKVFYSGSRKRLWEVRQLLHALRGRAISFYVPTFYDDLEPTEALSSASTSLKIKNIKYSSLVRNRSPKGDVQVLLTDGTKLNRQITNSTELSATEEQLTVSTQWGVDAALSEIARIAFIEKVRIDSDEVVLEHLDANGQARISAPIKTVLE
jgi:hypothetical protein